METRLKAARRACGWSQQRLIVELETLAKTSGQPMPTRASLKTQISRWENGHTSPQEPYRSMLAQIYQSAPADLGMQGHPGLWVPAQAVSPSSVSTPEFVTSMQTLLKSYARVDNEVGPRHVVRAVVQQLQQLEGTVLAMRGGRREELLRLCSRFAEFAGWLCHDAGDLVSAQQWTGVAHDLLEEVGSTHQRAYVLMRKSAIAADRGELTRAVSLADAVANDVDHMPASLAALVMRQCAIAHAMAHDSRAAQRSSGKALEFASAEAADHSSFEYCSEAFVRMEAGQAAYYLGQHDAAAEHLRQAAERWPDGYVRDKGMCLARLALVEACRGNIGAACTTGMEAVDLTRRTGSARAAAVVHALRRRLACHSGHTVVSEFISSSRP